jgi:hypothetical protein
MRSVVAIALAIFVSMAMQQLSIGAQGGPQEAQTIQPPQEKERGERKPWLPEEDEVQLTGRKIKEVIQGSQAALRLGDRVKAKGAIGEAETLLTTLEKDAGGPEARRVAATLRQETERTAKALEGEKPAPDLVPIWGDKVFKSLRVGFRFARAKDHLAVGDREKASQEVTQVSRFLSRQLILLKGAEHWQVVGLQQETETLAARLNRGEVKDQKLLDQLAEKIIKALEVVRLPHPEDPLERKRKVKAADEKEGE